MTLIFRKKTILAARGSLEDQEAELKTARWSHDNDYIVTCSRDRSIYVWAEHTGDVKDVTFSPDSTRLV